MLYSAPKIILPQKCNLCPLCGTKPPIKGAGSSAPFIVWVSLMPDKTNTLIDKEKAEILEIILNFSKIQKSKVYYTTLLKSYCKSSKSEYIKICKKFLFSELLDLKPKFVILEGSEVIKEFFENRHLTMSLIYGAILAHEQFPNINFIPIYELNKIYEDPNYALSISFAIDNAIKKSKEIAKKSTKYIEITNIETFNAVMDIIKNKPYLAIDIETTGKENFFDNKIVCITFSWEEGEAAFLPIYIGGKNYWDDNTYTYIKNTWNTIIGIKNTVYHNGFYDTRILKYHEFSYGKFFFDTQIAAKFINNIFQSVRLKNLAWYYTDMGGYDDSLENYKLLNDIKTDYSLIPIDILKSYAIKDADCTYRIFTKLKEEIDKSNGKNLFYKVYMELSSILLEWSYEGVLINKDYLINLKSEYEKSLEEIKLKIFALTGQEFNINSTPQLQKILYKKLKLNPTKETKTGFSTDKETLKQLANEHEIPKLLLDYREKDMVKKTFIEGILSSLDKDNRVHTTYNIGMMDTSRISSSNPNLQNLPRNNKDIKKAFIADTGYIYYEFDFSQIEIRVLAHLSQDPLLIEELNGGTDIHKVMASTAFNIPIENVTAELRTKAKAVSFGIIYGMGANSLAARINSTKKEAEQIIQNFFRKYKKIRGWMNSVEAYSIIHGFLYTYFGRKRYIPGVFFRNNNKIYSYSLRIAINTPIQSMAADITNIALIKMTSHFKEIKFKMQIHDAIIGLLPIDKHEQLYPQVANMMSTAVPLLVKTPVGIKRGFNLGEMEEVC